MTHYLANGDEISNDAAYVAEAAASVAVAIDDLTEAVRRMETVLLDTLAVVEAKVLTDEQRYHLAVSRKERDREAAR